MQSLRSTTATLCFACMAFIQIDGSNVQKSSCGRRLSGAYPLIARGRTAESWPWHAAIYHQNDKLEYTCGGTVISSNSVLTAAHCVAKYNDPMESIAVSVSLGRIKLHANESRAKSFEVAKIVLHPDYDFRDFSNDIAIVVLSTKVIFSNYVQPICLWKRNKRELSEVVDKDGTVVGWGRTETNNVSNILQQASMRVADSWKCLATNRDAFGSRLSKTNFCAGFRNGTNVCNGDSGGSLSFEENGVSYIRGIVSLYVGDETTSCNSFEYAIFTDVAQFLPWITNTAEICEQTVKCIHPPTWVGGTRVRDAFDICIIQLFVEISKRNCTFIFPANTNITTLEIGGGLGTNPNFSDAADKFESLKELQIAATLTVVGRKMFTPFTKIEAFYLIQTGLSEIGADVFDDLTNLLRLGIIVNPLREIHVDLFKELIDLQEIELNYNEINVLPEGVFRNNAKLKVIRLDNNKITEIPDDIFKDQLDLKTIHLDFNQLTILPVGIFRNNEQLETISLTNNRLAVIKFDFRNLPNLIQLYLKSNACIDENSEFEKYTNKTSINEMHNKIWRNCLS